MLVMPNDVIRGLLVQMEAECSATSLLSQSRLPNSLARTVSVCVEQKTTNWKTTKQNGTMTKAHQDQRTSKSNSISSSAQHESHCSRFFTSVTTPIVVQFAASKVIGRRTHELSKCFRPLHTWLDLYPVHRDAISQVVKSSLIHLQPVGEILGFIVGIKSTSPLEILE